MAIIINIDVVLAKQKMSVIELAEKEGVTMADISILKNGKAKAIRLSPPCSGSRLARTKGPSLDAGVRGMRCAPTQI